VRLLSLRQHTQRLGSAVAVPPSSSKCRTRQATASDLPSGSAPRQILLNEIWGCNSAVTTHTLETHIYRLRQKIEPAPTNARLLLAEGGGYRLDAVAGKV
jgi:hypothetical protein